MGETPPVEVGTRGTVGSLLKKEIEYFRKVEFDCCGRRRSSVNTSTTRKQGGDSSSGGNFRRLFTITWRRKKRKSGGDGFLPTICSAMDVAENGGVSGFSYRNLKADVKSYEV